MSRLHKSVRGLSAIGVLCDVVVASPLVRTRQTAEIVAAGLASRPQILSLDSLAPGGSAAGVIADLRKLTKYKRVAIVGHEPGIGELAARLAGSRRALVFKKGAVCRIDTDALPPDGVGDLRWFLTPKVLRSLR
jgi:phosphohistidine phosphatase